jgi:hypothetical protein
MRYICTVILLVTSVLCLSQTSRIQYKDWDGKMSELIHYKRTSSELILTIVPTEKLDTVLLIIGPITQEIENLFNCIVSYDYADDGWLYRAEELGQSVLYSHFRAPYPGDTTIRANYLECFFENKMFDKIE